MTEKQKIKICNKVIMHWWENLFLAYANELTVNDIDTSKYEFCNVFYYDVCHIYCGTWYEISSIINEKFPKHDKTHFNLILSLVEEFLIQLENASDKWINDEL
jgi:hypothetical protein